MTKVTCPDCGDQHDHRIKGCPIGLPVALDWRKSRCGSGFSATTPMYVQVSRKGRHVVRMGFACFRAANDPECGKKTPFDNDWCDNYVEGKGSTLDAALRDMNRQIDSIIESLHA